MKPKQKIPAFKTEAEEAAWWFKNRAELDRRFGEAVKSGKAKRLDAANLASILSTSKARVVSIRLPEDDIQLARQQAARKGLPYQTYIKSLLHQALHSSR